MKNNFKTLTLKDEEKIHKIVEDSVNSFRDEFDKLCQKYKLKAVAFGTTPESKPFIDHEGKTKTQSAGFAAVGLQAESFSGREMENVMDQIGEFVQYIHDYDFDEDDEEDDDCNVSELTEEERIEKIMKDFFGE